MNFSANDIQRLYGKRFFLLEETEAPESSEKSVPQESQAESEPAPEPETPSTPSWLGAGAVDWKLKPHAEVAFVLHAEEFANKDLTTFFKGKVVEAHIDLKTIGFGVLGESQSGWEIGSIQTENPNVRRVLLCHDAPEAPAIQAEKLEQVVVVLAPSLQRARFDEAAAQELAQAIKQLTA